ncbi:hypothetical protein HaLaN_12763 [Haematococcus lacustris]|uniref:Uncharacterized protein n=1 Tax=Haematococcus lacustris TaxID=44745 RepID=A0A699Z476_HAELA|nr:hypothetical protein HaLaN_12763 [Haematococcus lacustris]
MVPPSTPSPAPARPLVAPTSAGDTAQLDSSLTQTQPAQPAAHQASEEDQAGPPIAKRPRLEQSGHKAGAQQSSTEPAPERPGVQTEGPVAGDMDTGLSCPGGGDESLGHLLFTQQGSSAHQGQLAGRHAWEVRRWPGRGAGREGAVAGPAAARAARLFPLLLPASDLPKQQERSEAGQQAARSATGATATTAARDAAGPMVVEEGSGSAALLSDPTPSLVPLPSSGGAAAAPKQQGVAAGDVPSPDLGLSAVLTEFNAKAGAVLQSAQAVQQAAQALAAVTESVGSVAVAEGGGARQRGGRGGASLPCRGGQVRGGPVRPGPVSPPMGGLGKRARKQGWEGWEGRGKVNGQHTPMITPPAAYCSLAAPYLAVPRSEQLRLSAVCWACALYQEAVRADGEWEREHRHRHSRSQAPQMHRPVGRGVGAMVGWQHGKR